MKLICPRCKSHFDFHGSGALAEQIEVECCHCHLKYRLTLQEPQAFSEDEMLLPDDLPRQMPVGEDTRYPDDPLQALRKVFGYKAFRPYQSEIIESLISGQDVFALMPTGSGKSICFQIPSMLREGVGVVVSPLIALMQDQVDDLRQYGIRAAYLNSSLSAQAAADVEARAVQGNLDVLYVAPERLLTARFDQLLRRMPLALFAIDEAHCVSQWGHDFRPEYLQIADVTHQFPNVPRIAMTATADQVTRREIIAKLDLPKAQPFIASFDRPNIFYRVQLKVNGNQQLLAFIQQEHAGDAGIVYVRTRKRADDTADWLRGKGLNALAYHAGLDPATRRRHQQQFLRQDGIVMVATIAFGMGIDKPDVRFVAHLDLPASMEAYYQETGRAGRDGLPADAWMAYSLSDVVLIRKLIETSEGSQTYKTVQQRKLGALLGFCETTGCRREALLRYFDEGYQGPCNTCDNCVTPVDTWDGTIAAQKALSCVYRTGQRFGAAYLTNVLLGNADERIRRFRHDRIKTFGVGQNLSSGDWRSVFRQLLAGGMLDADLGSRSGFRLNEASWRILKGEQAVRFRKDPRPAKALAPPKRAAKAPGPAAVELCSEAAQQLWEKLRRLRLELARELNLPPYVIFHDKTLKEMAVQRPKTRDAFLMINGVGEAKMEKYGDAFLEVLRADEKSESSAAGPPSEEAAAPLKPPPTSA